MNVKTMLARSITIQHMCCLLRTTWMDCNQIIICHVSRMRCLLKRRSRPSLVTVISITNFLSSTFALTEKLNNPETNVWCKDKVVISWQCVSNFIFIHRLILGFGDVANLRNQKTEHTL
jgi:hypothetical protein